MARIRTYGLGALLMLAGVFASAHAADSVVDYVKDNKDNFGILLKVVQAADQELINQLARPGLVATVFAPTDAAFRKLLRDLGLTEAQLLRNQDLISKVLRHHIIPGKRVRSTAIAPRDSFKTFLWNGGDNVIVARRRGGRVTITSSSGNTARVVAADVRAGRALIHAIDAVLVPQLWD